MIRSAAITGRPDEVHAWFADRQGGRWAEQMIRGAIPAAHGSPAPRSAHNPAGADSAETLRELTELHRRGVITDAEFESLRLASAPKSRVRRSHVGQTPSKPGHSQAASHGPARTRTALLIGQFCVRG